MTPRILLSSLVALAFAGSLFGQPPPDRFRGGRKFPPPPPSPPSSHVPIPNDALPKDIHKWLAERKGQPAKGKFDVEALGKLFKELGLDNPNTLREFLGDPEEVRKWVENSPLLKDPEFLESLRDPKTLEGLQSLLKDFREENGSDPRLKNFDAGRFTEQFKDLLEKRQPDPNFRPVGPMSPVGPMANVTPPPPPPPPPPPQEDRRSREMARWFRNNFGDSPAVKNMVKDFSRLMGEAGNGDGKMFSWLPDLNSATGGTWAERNLGFLKDVKLPDIKFPSLKLPSLGSGGGPRIGGGGGGWSGGGGAGGGGGGSWAPLIILVVLAAAGLAVWVVIVNRQAAHKSKEEKPRRAASWPVDPALISSREELVKAFEHLSLTKYGENARVWTHRTIAGRIADEGKPQQAAAVTLASLYEQARYTPQTEHLTETQFAEARRQFRILSEGAPA